jgi:hypothetical protein
MAALLLPQVLDYEYLILMNFNQHFSGVSTKPINIYISIDFEGGIKLGEMLFRTNIIGFVGTGDNSSYPSTRLILWDDIQHRPFGELNFKTDVLNVKLRKDR